MPSIANPDGSAASVVGELAAECEGAPLFRLRCLIAATLQSRGLTYEHVGQVLNVDRSYAFKLCKAVPEWQVRRSREIIDEAVCELLD